MTRERERALFKHESYRTLTSVSVVVKVYIRENDEKVVLHACGPLSSFAAILVWSFIIAS